MRLTPNQRMVYYLEKIKGEKAVSFPDWIQGFWLELNRDISELPVLLNAAEQEIVWERIISKSDQVQQILKTGSLARLCMDTWDLSQKWQVPIENALFLTQDNSLYQEWAAQYQATCQKHHWLDASSLLSKLSELSAQHPELFKKLKALPKAIHCVGFLEWTPQQKTFIDTLKTLGVACTNSSLLQTPGEVCVVPCQDPEEELLFALAMVKRWRAEYPQGRYAIIIPDLPLRRQEILRIFEQQLGLDNCNISAPIALNEYPIIEAALLIFDLMQPKISLEQLSQLLRSPFWGGSQQECSERAALDVLVRKQGEFEFDFARVLPLLERLNQSLPEPGARVCIENLRVLFSMRPDFYGKQKTFHWKTLINKALEDVKWLEGRPLTALEVQLKEQWQLLLDEYENMDRILSEHKFSEAKKRLRRLAALKLFLPKEAVQSMTAPLQVLGLLEGVSIPFDAIWMVGLHQKAWPQPPSPNPFLPLNMQKANNLPRSSAARELKVAKRLMDEYQKSATKVFLSYPLTLDNEPCLPSPLISTFKTVTAESLQLGPVTSYLATKIKQATSGAMSLLAENGFVKYVVNKDERGPIVSLNFEGQCAPASKTQPVLVNGGTHTLKLQAACPFRAFAEYRLQAKPISKPQLGLNEAERGEIIHQVLLQFWRNVKTQDRLNALTEETLAAQLTAVINKEVELWRQRFSDRLQNEYCQLERQRLFDLMWRFMQNEKQRPAFQVIAQEILEEVQIGSLKFKLRIDRIDRVDRVVEIDRVEKVNGGGEHDNKAEMDIEKEIVRDPMNGPEARLGSVNKTNSMAINKVIDRVVVSDEIIIDYKTGKIALSDWFGERPNDPQLPLYSVTRHATPAAVAFAVIRPEKIEFVGLSEQDGYLPGVKTVEKAKRLGAEETFAAQLEAWHRVIENLAEEFSQGVADVNPRDGASTCRNCALSTICRVEHSL